jgi:hypothetical protein
VTARPVISALDAECNGIKHLTQSRLTVAMTVTTFTANRALYFPVTLAEPYVLRRFWWVNGATVNGNVDVGLYTASGLRIASCGSTAMSGASALQSVVLGSPVHLPPGSYYLAWAPSSGTATFPYAAAGGVAEGRIFGMAVEDSAVPLPASATFATTTTARTVLCGMSNRTT